MLRPSVRHREAAAQYARALRFAAAQPAARRAELETRLADALYATDDQVESIAARPRAIEHLRAAGDAVGEGAPCHLVTSYSCRGMMADARAAAEEALRVLEPSTRRRRWARRTTRSRCSRSTATISTLRPSGASARSSAPATTLSRLPTL